MRKQLLFLFIFLCSFAFGQTAKEVLNMQPEPRKLVFDYGNFMPLADAQALSRNLTNYFDSTGTQIVVLTINDLDGQDIAQFATELGHRWKIGEEKEDNGVLLILSKNDRKSHIATGYGVEGALPDLLCNRILQEVMKPLLKQGQYVTALNMGVASIQSALNGEGFKNHRTKGNGDMWKSILVVVAIIVFVIISNKRRGGGSSYMGRNGARSWGNSGFWFFPTGGFGGGGSSGGSSGGGFGDFGGFGGGDFGGGGSSGDW